MIINKTKNATLTKNTKLITGLFRQAFGLMFRKTLNNTGWVFLLPRKSKWHVTNLFVFQTITVLWLDENKKVLQSRLVKPFTPHIAGIKNTCFLLELPASAFSKVAVGDEIAWKESKRI